MDATTFATDTSLPLLTPRPRGLMEDHTGTPPPSGAAIGGALGTLAGFALGVFVVVTSEVTVPVAVAWGTIAATTAVGAGVGTAFGVVNDWSQSKSDSGGGVGSDAGPGPQGASGGGTDAGGDSSGGSGGSSGGSSGGGACFVAGTPVLLANGRRVPIESVQVGEYVASQDAASSIIEGQPATRRFVHHVSSTLLLQLSDGNHLHTTRDHRFFVPQRGFVAAGSLEPGATLVTHRDGYAKLVKSVQVEAPATVYNLEVAAHHTFFVGEQGIWVHNDKDVHDPDAGG